MWLAEHLYKESIAFRQEGNISSKSFGELRLSIRMREKKMGRFITVMAKSRKIPGGQCFLYLLWEDSLGGWERLYIRITILAKHIGQQSYPRMNTRAVGEENEGASKCGPVIASENQSLNKPPFITGHYEKKAVMEITETSSFNRVASASRIDYGGISISIRRCRTDDVCNKDTCERWIIVKGALDHMRNIFAFSFCMKDLEECPKPLSFQWKAAMWGIPELKSDFYYQNMRSSRYHSL